MSPSSGRWRPRRAGIVNLYEYANQVFDFAEQMLAVQRQFAKNLSAIAASTQPKP